MTNAKQPKWIQIRIENSNKFCHVRADIICAFIPFQKVGQNGLPVIDTSGLHSIMCTNGLSVIVNQIELKRVQNEVMSESK